MDEEEVKQASQELSPTMTRGARSWWRSEAETGVPFSRLLCCLRLASLEFEGGERRIEQELALTTRGRCCHTSSISSLSASCLFTATAFLEKNVRSLALLFLVREGKGSVRTPLVYMNSNTKAEQSPLHGVRLSLTSEVSWMLAGCWERTEEGRENYIINKEHLGDSIQRAHKLRGLRLCVYTGTHIIYIQGVHTIRKH